MAVLSIALPKLYASHVLGSGHADHLNDGQAALIADRYNRLGAERLRLAYPGTEVTVEFDPLDDTFIVVDGEDTEDDVTEAINEIAMSLWGDDALWGDIPSEPEVPDAAR